MSSILAAQIKAIIWKEDLKGAVHPYLTVWMGCRRYSTELYRVLPDGGGWLDQDAELMLAFDILEEAYETETQAKKRWDEVQKMQLPVQTTGPRGAN